MSRKASATPAQRDPLASNAYRLRHWPQVPDRFRTAPVLRAFSRMTLGPVTGRWFIQHTGLAAAEAAELLAELAPQRAIETIAFDVHCHPDAAQEPARAARRLPLREMVVAALFCWAIAAPGGQWTPTRNLADLLTDLGVATLGC